MTHILHTHRVVSHRIRLLASCAFAAASLALSAVPAMAGCNSGNVADTALLSGGGCQANADGVNATAVGSGAAALGANAMAVGHNAGSLFSVAGATNVGTFSGSIGTGVYSTAVGSGISGPTASRAQGSYSIAIGGGDGALFTPSIGPAINLDGAQATGFISTAVGAASQATGGGSSAFGLASRATGPNSAAYGEFSRASGDSSVAIGLFSTASANSSLALGPQARATKPRSVAIGSGSLANVANTVSVGTNALRRRIVNVAAGVNPTDAVNLAQLQAALSVAPASASAPNGNAELSALRALLQQQAAQLEQFKQEIAEVKRSNAAARALP